MLHLLVIDAKKFVVFLLPLNPFNKLKLSKNTCCSPKEEKEIKSWINPSKAWSKEEEAKKWRHSDKGYHIRMKKVRKETFEWKLNPFEWTEKENIFGWAYRMETMKTYLNEDKVIWM